MARFWDLVRPIYNFALKTSAKSGLPRVVNGTDPLLFASELRGITEVYEPDVWSRVMSALRPGDAFVDVGAYVGLYAVAAAKRVAPTGHVYAFEPDALNYAALRKQVELNHVRDRVDVRETAIGESDGIVQFSGGRSSESMMEIDTARGHSVPIARLDTLLPGAAVDVMKIDVEGFEEHVLKGATRLLSDPERRPRLMSIEVRPYNWHVAGGSSESLLGLLTDADYRAENIAGEAIQSVRKYGQIFAIANKSVNYRCS